MTVSEGMMIGLIGIGVQFDKITTDGDLIIYISIPEKTEGASLTTDEFSLKIKELLKEALQNSSLRVFSKVRKGEYFTKDMGVKAAEQFIEDKYKYKMWGLL
jgi:hypothetical protein